MNDSQQRAYFENAFDRVRNRSRLTLGLTCLTCILVLLGFTKLNGGEVRNSTFNEPRGTTMTAAMVRALRKNGWTCPDNKLWPHSWGGQGAGMTVEFPATGGRNNDSFCRLSGGVNGYVNGYWGKLFKKTQVLTFWARGRGTLRVGLVAYKLAADKMTILPGGQMQPLTIRVNTRDWVRYRYLMRKPGYELTGHPLFQVVKGTIDFDDVDIIDSDPALDLIVAEENKLYGTMAVIENLGRAQIDSAFPTRVKQYDAAVAGFHAARLRLPKNLTVPMQKLIKTLHPYVHTRRITSIRSTHYNEMILMTRVLKRSVGKSPGAVIALNARRVETSTRPHYPGKREPRAGQVTITRVRSNKVRYVENELATTTATIVNKMATTIRGKFRARMILDLDQVRAIAAEKPFSLQPGEEARWTFTYNVGPETYGRAIEVELVDPKGKRLDAWQEYYAVAAEFFRIHQHSYQTKTKYWQEDPFIFYFNQSHYFAHEPTGFGAETFDAQVYISGQAGYRINVPLRKAQIAHNKTLGIATTFYVIPSFDGQMGYEQARKHPEFLLYDANGQPAADPIYGGFPNPMELASPIEVGPNRKKLKIKPYLDRKYTPWQHVGVNLADKDTLIWALKRMKKYALAWGFDGLYWDGCLGVWTGYNHLGNRNIPSGKYEDYVALAKRNHRLFNQILKRDNPNFGTWLNWGLEGATGDFAKKNGITIWLGSGVKGDSLDHNVRAATNAKNVMLLDEHQSFGGSDYRKLLTDRLRSRDHFVQKYGASHTIGYASIGVNMHEPGPTKWGWPAWNHVLSQLIATQSHVATHFLPSHRPSFQFMTRYSRFLWARDIKAVSPLNAQKEIRVKTAEDIWWKRLVYERKTSQGRDLLVHLVRIPPTKNVDYGWADEPRPLKGTTLTVGTRGSTLQSVQACRPYHYEEPQQVVQTSLVPKAVAGKASVVIPPFRYHTMVVFRFKNKR